MQQKVMFSIDEGLLSEIEKYAEKMHLNRSAAVSVLCSTSLSADESIRVLSRLLDYMDEGLTPKEAENKVLGD